MASSTCTVEFGPIDGLTLYGIRFETAHRPPPRAQGTFRVTLPFKCIKGGEYPCENDCTQQWRRVRLTGVVSYLKWWNPNHFSLCQREAWDRCMPLLVRDSESEWKKCIGKGTAACPPLQAHHFINVNEASKSLMDEIKTNDEWANMVAESFCTCPTVIPGTDIAMATAIPDTVSVEGASLREEDINAAEILGMYSFRNGRNRGR